MSDPHDAARTIARGTWLYDNAAPFSVAIVAFPFDYWLVMGPADYEDGPIEATPLGPNGLLYYVSFGEHRVDSAGYETLHDAKVQAQRSAPSPITWEE